MTSPESDFYANLADWYEGSSITTLEGNILRVEAIPGQEVCDFCAEPWPENGLIYPATFDDGWCACDPCSVLIDADDGPGLLSRSVRLAEDRWGKIPQATRSFAEALLASNLVEFIQNRDGEPFRDKPGGQQ